MISLKRFLSIDDAAEMAAHTRLAWLILEAIACHAVESDPAERLTFQTNLRALATKMEHAAGDPEALVLAGEAIHSIETYNRGVERALNSQLKELQSIVSLFTRSLLQVAKSSTSAAMKLREIDRQIEKSSQTDDLRALKAQLEKSLETICEEAKEQERRGEQIGEQIREAMSRPESAAVLSEAVADLDLTTGLPNFRAAQLAIRSAIAAGTRTYAVLFSVDRVEVVNTRFGFSVGDRILMLFGQHLAQRFSNADRLFRWRGPAFLALIERTGAEMPIRAEIARIVTARLEQEIELGGRSVLLPIAASWMLTNLATGSAEEITRKLDAFSTGQAGNQ